MARLRARLLKMFILTIKQLQDPYYQGFAAQVSFYLLLSIVPIFLLMTQILGIFDISLESALKLIESYTGREMSAMFRELFEFRSAGLSSVVFAAIALWAGSRASFSIMRITNYTLTGGKSTGRNYFIERFRAIKTIVITIFTISFSLIILAYGKLILEAILSVLRLIHKYMPTTYGCGSDGYWAFFFTSLWSAIITICCLRRRSRSGRCFRAAYLLR